MLTVETNGSTLRKISLSFVTRAANLFVLYTAVRVFEKASVEVPSLPSTSPCGGIAVSVRVFGLPLAPKGLVDNLLPHLPENHRYHYLLRWPCLECLLD